MSSDNVEPPVKKTWSERKFVMAVAILFVGGMVAIFYISPYYSFPIELEKPKMIHADCDNWMEINFVNHIAYCHSSNGTYTLHQDVGGNWVR